MFKKKTNNSFSPLFFPLIFSACLLGNNLSAMEGKEQDSSPVLAVKQVPYEQLVAFDTQTIKQLPREQLENIFLQQQSMLKKQGNVLNARNNREKKVLEILGTPVSPAVAHLIELAIRCKKEDVPFSKAFNEATDTSRSVGNKALANYVQEEIKNFTVREVLENTEIPIIIVRRFFRGLLVGIPVDAVERDEAFINFKLLDEEQKNISDWIVTKPTDLSVHRMLYQKDSLMDHLIETCVSIRNKLADINPPQNGMKLCFFCS